MPLEFLLFVDGTDPVMSLFMLYYQILLGVHATDLTLEAIFLL